MPANAEPMKPPAPVSNIVFPKIAFSTGFFVPKDCSTLQQAALIMCTRFGIYRRTEGSAGARPEAGIFTEGLRRKVAREMLFPGAKHSSNENKLTEVVSIMVCCQQSLAQNGLPIAMRYLSEQVGRLVR
ncbi:MAG: hypothetical protein QOJ41_3047 [Acidobacteriaceae bacterium]|nr:hypothetical protein [Acidobacteriaceae bacterium]